MELLTAPRSLAIPAKWLWTMFGAPCGKGAATEMARLQRSFPPGHNGQYRPLSAFFGTVLGHHELLFIPSAC